MATRTLIEVAPTHRTARFSALVVATLVDVVAAVAVALVVSEPSVFDYAQPLAPSVALGASALGMAAAAATVAACWRPFGAFAVGLRKRIAWAAGVSAVAAVLGAAVEFLPSTWLVFASVLFAMLALLTVSFVARDLALSRPR